MFVKADDLSQWLKKTITDDVAERHIAVAQDLVMAAVGAESWDATQVDETHRILYDMDQDEPVVVRSKRPISEMLEIYVDGTAQTLSDFEVGHWTVRRIDDTKIPKNSDFRIVFNAGYEENPNDSSGAGGMPARLKTAILITAAEAYNSPDMQYQSERIGDYAYSRPSRFAADAMSALPKRAQDLIIGFRRPGSIL